MPDYWSRSYLYMLQKSSQSNGEEEPQSLDEPDNINVVEMAVVEPSTTQTSRATSQGPSGAPDLSQMDPEINSPIHAPECASFVMDQSSSHRFVGESTCAAFGDGILQCLNATPLTLSHPLDRQYVNNPTFARQLSSAEKYQFPDRVRAYLLVRIALRFIGEDYHFFIHSDFYQMMEKVYGSSRQSLKPDYDPVWVCKFFVILAMGQLYSSSHPTAAKPGTDVPGTDFFLTAVSLLQDQFEEPSISYIEVLLLFVGDPLRYAELNT
jgi:proline utilization trans-activator